MAPLKWIIIALALLEAGWMTFDGARALTVGDYVTPQEGPHAGQLGPWTSLVKAVGIEPRSTLMKSIFLIYGIAWLTIIVCFASGLPWAWSAMLALAIGSLWYLPVGTACAVIQLVLLALWRGRVARGA
jgi:hypothetical protein